MLVEPRRWQPEDPLVRHLIGDVADQLGERCAPRVLGDRLGPQAPSARRSLRSRSHSLRLSSRKSCRPRRRNRRDVWQQHRRVQTTMNTGTGGQRRRLGSPSPTSSSRTISGRHWTHSRLRVPNRSSTRCGPCSPTQWAPFTTSKIRRMPTVSTIRFASPSTSSLPKRAAVGAQDRQFSAPSASRSRRWPIPMRDVSSLGRRSMRMKSLRRRSGYSLMYCRCIPTPSRGGPLPSLPATHAACGSEITKTLPVRASGWSHKQAQNGRTPRSMPSSRWSIPIRPRHIRISTRRAARISRTGFASSGWAFCRPSPPTACRPPAVDWSGKSNAASRAPMGECAETARHG